MKIDIVVGGQYGSEAKGHVTQRILNEFHIRNQRSYPGRVLPRQVNVRVAGPNAGHTAYDSAGRKWALRQVPVGAVSDQPMVLAIAPGSEIDPDVLIGEIDALTTAGHLANKILCIDPTATVITDQHKQFESIAGLVGKIGSTGKGIGAARADRVMRRADRLIDLPQLVAHLHTANVRVSAMDYRPTDHVFIEGTQGYGLGLHGPVYPQCTSSDCTAIDFLAMAGLNPWNAYIAIHVVARMYPIRVAGNSGPMYKETSWEALGLEPEFTTVTQKKRRVGEWDALLVREAVKANGGHPAATIALTMVDQKWPGLAGVRSNGELVESVGSASLFEFIKQVQAETGTQVTQITTGPTTGVFL